LRAVLGLGQAGGQTALIESMPKYPGFHLLRDPSSLGVPATSLMASVVGIAAHPRRAPRWSRRRRDIGRSIEIGWRGEAVTLHDGQRKLLDRLTGRAEDAAGRAARRFASALTAALDAPG
jgi:hypothetical protein